MNKALEAKVITKDELNAKMTKAAPFQLLNVLEPKYYDLGVIAGSLRIPLSELEKRSAELDESKEVVTYSTDLSCGASRKAAEMLAEKGFSASAYVGGIKEWTAAKLPVEEEPAAAHIDEANA